MDRRDVRTSGQSVREPQPRYEPPRVERVLTLADLEREVLYAGPTASDDPV